MSKKIIIKGARLHNLKNISLSIPKEKLIVITGVSGSGKSTLAFDTIFAEGQRRYIESLSSYARQFLGKIQKPDVDEIINISPAVAIEQKTIINNPRSTVATNTEIYDYLKLLYARIGKTYSPLSNEEVKCSQTIDVINYIKRIEKNKKILILFKSNLNSNDINIQKINKIGFTRIFINNKEYKIKDILKKGDYSKEDFYIIVDRIFSEDLINNYNKINESIETAFEYGNGNCYIFSENIKLERFSNKFEKDGMKFEKPSTNLFAFNNPFGACKKCQGFGSILDIDENKVIPNKKLSIFENAVVCWSGLKSSKWKDRFIKNSFEFNFPIHKPYEELDNEQKNILWNGHNHCQGIFDFFNMLEVKKYKIQNRVMLAKYKGKTNCPECKGSRLRKEARYVKINNKSIDEINNMSIIQAYEFLKNIKLSKKEIEISKRIINEILNRLEYLKEVGLDYICLNRLSNTLSGGESQRINLAKSIGSALIGTMYILDEPSIGLHPKDTQRLINILEKLKNLGNTVIIVEHAEEIIAAADEIIDIGKGAGIHGGEIVFQGSFKNIINDKNSLTGKYLSEKKHIKIPNYRIPKRDFIKITNINQYNLKNLNVIFPLNMLTLITGVSGSGKSTLVKNVLAPAINNCLKNYIPQNKNYNKVIISTNSLKNVELITQNPIGRSSRSNPVTYLKVYDDIRKLFANQTLSKIRKFKPGFFSFNIPGGRCEYCQGEGENTIEMQFMADIRLQCEECKGARFKKEILEIKFENKNINNILNLSIEEAKDFFEKNNQINIANKLKPLLDVGLGYIKLGQSSSTLSGGEAQRIKLAFFLSKGGTDQKTLFIFDEPTTGLHFHDIQKLLNSFYSLIKKGHSIICIEHNLDVIKCADWIIDLGPDGGENGGKIIFEGVPEKIIKKRESFTGQFLKQKL